MTTMTVVGRLGVDGQLKHTSQGTAVTELAIAYNYGRKDADGRRQTQWVRASLWGRQAEALVPYLSKGTGVIATLEDVHIREFTKQDGSNGYSLQGNVIKFEFAPGGREVSAENHSPAPAQPAVITSPKTSTQGNMGHFDAGDIPF